MTDQPTDKPAGKRASSGRGGEDGAELSSGLRDALRESADTVPPDVAERLASMRHAAVQELDTRHSARRGWTITGAFAGSAAALVLAVVLVFQLDNESVNDTLLADPDEMAAIEDLEILEDLEFLAWLEKETLDASQG